jgi:hypothetical protein
MADWEKIIPDMAAEAKLTPDKVALLRDYIFGELGKPVVQ